MDNVYTYLVDLPDGIDEAVLPCLEGYTIYLDNSLSPSGLERAYYHALEHIANNDFDKTNVNKIEAEADRRDL